jgi:hypothetical protein
VDDGEELKYCCELADPGAGGCGVDIAFAFASAFIGGESSCSSTLMSFPCRELGGGGFFLPVAEDAVSEPRWSSSGSDTSCDVWGDPGSASCIGSKTDCRDIDVAVLLLPSPSP